MMIHFFLFLLPNLLHCANFFLLLVNIQFLWLNKKTNPFSPWLCCGEDRSVCERHGFESGSFSGIFWRFIWNYILKLWIWFLNEKKNVFFVLFWFHSQVPSVSNLSFTDTISFSSFFSLYLIPIRNVIELWMALGRKRMPEKVQIRF